MDNQTAGMNSAQLDAYGLFWSQIMAASTSHMSTADMWNLIRDEAGRLGMETPGVSPIAIMQLRSRAAQIVGASERLNAGERETGILPQMIAQAPYSRPLEVQDLAPMYNVSFLARGVDAEGNDAESWMTAVFTGSLPDTIGGLFDSIFSSASDIVATSDGEYENLAEVAGVSDLTIVAV